MSRPETPAASAVPTVAPRTFLALAVGFLLLYAGVLAFAWQQKAARAGLERVVPLPPRAEDSPTAVPPKPAPPSEP